MEARGSRDGQEGKGQNVGVIACACLWGIVGQGRVAHSHRARWRSALPGSTSMLLSEGLRGPEYEARPLLARTMAMEQKLYAKHDTKRSMLRGTMRA